MQVPRVNRMDAPIVEKMVQRETETSWPDTGLYCLSVMNVNIHTKYQNVHQLSNVYVNARWEIKEFEKNIDFVHLSSSTSSFSHGELSMNHFCLSRYKKCTYGQKRKIIYLPTYSTLKRLGRVWGNTNIFKVGLKNLLPTSYLKKKYMSNSSFHCYSLQSAISNGSTMGSRCLNFEENNNLTYESEP